MLDPYPSIRRCAALSFTMVSIALSLLISIAAQADPEPWLGSDELLHLGAGAAISASGYAIGTELGGRAPRLILGAVLGLGAAAGKELADLAGIGEPSWKDFAFGAGGAAIGLFVAWLIDRLLEEPKTPIWLKLPSVVKWATDAR